MAVEALLSLAFDSSSAERPSTSRRLTSLPSVAPTMAPFELTTSTTSGSGLFQLEMGCSPASMPCPTADIGWPLVKISASGPMPTSRYCDQAPCSISTRFSSAACGLPGTSVRMLPPSWACTLLRIASAFSGAPRACSSMTRSSIDSGKGDARRLDGLQVVGREQPGLARIAAGFRRVGENGLERADALGPCRRARWPPDCPPRTDRAWSAPAARCRARRRRGSRPPPGRPLPAAKRGRRGRRSCRPSAALLPASCDRLCAPSFPPAQR